MTVIVQEEGLAGLKMVAGLNMTLHITVCMKQVPETDEVRIDRATGTLVREGVPCIINPPDLNALEEALRIRERIKSGATEGATASAPVFTPVVTVVSMGPPQTEASLRDALALGADRAVLLCDRAFAGADTLATSYTLAAAIRRLWGDQGTMLIICGNKSADGDTGHVGPQLAEKLGIPHITSVRRLDLDMEGPEVAGVRAERLVDDGYEAVEAPLPLLVTVVKGINSPRLPSLKGMMRAKKAVITVWGASDLDVDAGRTGLAGSATRVVKVFEPERPKSRGEFLTGTPEEQARELLGKLREARVLL